MALETVQKYVTTARVLLQDEVEPYRYEDAELLVALNTAIMEARRIRPDLFLETFDDLPGDFSAVNTTAVAIDEQYRSAFLYYIVGHAQARDEEDIQDQRAANFLNIFREQLKGG